MTATRKDTQRPAGERERPAGERERLASERERPAGERERLASERERLTERFVLMQSELGGLLYEMAIRDHLQLDLLVERAAAMQRLEAELRALGPKAGTENPELETSPRSPC